MLFRVPFLCALLLIVVACGPEAPPRAGDAPTPSDPLLPTRAAAGDGPTMAATLTPLPTAVRAATAVPVPPTTEVMPTASVNATPSPQAGTDRLPELVLARSLGSPDAPITMVEFSDYQ